MSSENQLTPVEPLLHIARDLTAALAAEDRYARLLSALRRVIPCDAAALMRLDGNDLIPLAAHGLTPEALARRFDRREHPRLDSILRSEEPVFFPEDSPLADPFDGYVASDPHALDHIHACLGCRLTDGGEVVGALTADALEPRAFDTLDRRVIAILGALAGAALRTTGLIEALESTARRRGQVARELLRTASLTRGGEILGTSPSIVKLRREIALVAGSDLAVLVTGPTGVGKELVARQIHQLSGRSEEALIHVNCAALPESVAESELFGHVAGAFTGATRDRAGKFEVAAGGTILLDEVGELPPSIQPKLLRVLQEGDIQRVGSDKAIRVNVRVIAATNRDLDAEVRVGRFRADLFHRLAVYPIHVPALKDRREDIPLLAAHFVDVSRRRLGLGPIRLTDEARRRLMASSWPGNVRELKNVISRGVLRAASHPRAEGATIHLGAELLDLTEGEAGDEGPRDASGAPSAETARLSLRDRMAAFRLQEIRAALERHGGNHAAAARDLGMHRSNFHRLARRLGVG